MIKWIVTLFGLLVFYACLQASEQALRKGPWNVLGYFDGEYADLERICDYNINQLEQVDPEFARITAMFDIPYTKNRDSSVRLYDIKKDHDLTRINSNSVSIGERDMGAPEVLDEFLSKYLGEKNILIIKAHGYGIIPGWARIGYNTPPNPIAINKVLRERLARPLDVLIFDSCNMATVEVAYEFKGIVSVMVASQDLMYYSMDATEKNTVATRPGIDYKGLVMNLKPNSKPITIGKDVVKGYMDIVNKQDASNNKSTISAVDLGILDVSLFKKHAEKLLNGLNNTETRQRYQSAISKALDEASYFRPLGRQRVATYYDIDHFFQLLELNLGEAFERPDTGVIQSYSNHFIRAASGLSVLFYKDLSRMAPERRERLLQQYSKSKFARDTGWDKLVRAYHTCTLPLN